MKNPFKILAFAFCLSGFPLGCFDEGPYAPPNDEDPEDSSTSTWKQINFEVSSLSLKFDPDDYNLAQSILCRNDPTQTPNSIKMVLSGKVKVTYQRVGGSTTQTKQLDFSTDPPVDANGKILENYFMKEYPDPTTGGTVKLPLTCKNFDFIVKRWTFDHGNPVWGDIPFSIDYDTCILKIIPGNYIGIIVTVYSEFDGSVEGKVEEKLGCYEDSLGRLLRWETQQKRKTLRRST